MSDMKMLSIIFGLVGQIIIRWKVRTMANTQPSWNGQRAASLSIPHPSPEAVWLHPKADRATATLSIAANGQNPMYALNRRQIFGLMMQCADVLKQMEPGRWP